MTETQALTLNLVPFETSSEGAEVFSLRFVTSLLSRKVAHSLGSQIVIQCGPLLAVSDLGGGLRGADKCVRPICIAALVRRS